MRNYGQETEQNASKGKSNSSRLKKRKIKQKLKRQRSNQILRRRLNSLISI